MLRSPFLRSSIAQDFDTNNNNNMTNLRKKILTTMNFRFWKYLLINWCMWTGSGAKASLNSSTSFETTSDSSTYP
ncbi:unnamed protein product [Lathyrus sativus]|nr:unnamed protein product [Lathyrus sativus]